jgi:hypothetical protein
LVTSITIASFGKGLELPVITFLNTNTISEFLSENYFSNSIYVVFLTTEFHKINRFVIYPIPNSFNALCMMVSLTAQNTNLMFSVSITCKEKERKKCRKQINYSPVAHVKCE